MKKRLIAITVATGMMLSACGLLNKSEKPAKPVPASNTDTQEETETEETEIETEEQADAELEKAVDEWLATHTIEEKVAQMFMITPEALAGVDTVTMAGSMTEQAIMSHPVGGLIYFSQNLQSTDQVKELLANTKGFYETHNFAKPFLAVDEEGGEVCRVASNEALGIANVGDMSEIGYTGDPSNAAQAGSTIGGYLAELGFNVDFAPVADVVTNPFSDVIGNRSFGSNPELVAQMVAAEADAMEAAGVTPVIKHFPGHGNTDADSHEGNAVLDKSFDELTECELVPFKKAIDSGADMIMVGHISTPGIIHSGKPASLSGYMISDLLRYDLGFDGVVITDAMNMSAITENYTSAEATLKAIEAGADMILMPEDFAASYDAVLYAVNAGELTEKRINESVRRILMVKLAE